MSNLVSEFTIMEYDSNLNSSFEFYDFRSDNKGESRVFCKDCINLVFKRTKKETNNNNLFISCTTWNKYEFIDYIDGCEDSCCNSCQNCGKPLLPTIKADKKEMLKNAIQIADYLEDQSLIKSGQLSLFEVS